jgi:hypothetical protein
MKNPDPENVLGRYILDAAGNPVPEPDLYRWARWYQTAERHVALDRLDDGHWVSTVFLALDHGFASMFGEGPPILYETMVFGDYGSLETDWNGQRYATRAEALAGHAAALVELKLLLSDIPHDRDRRTDR